MYLLKVMLLPSWNVYFCFFQTLAKINIPLFFSWTIIPVLQLKKAKNFKGTLTGTDLWEPIQKLVRTGALPGKN